MKVTTTIDSLAAIKMKDRISAAAAAILRGWEASDLTTHDSADWDVIPWKRFHATAYYYVVTPCHTPPPAGERPRLVAGQYIIDLTPATDTDRKVYVSDKFGPFIQSMREAMFNLTEDLGPPNFGRRGVAYVAMSGLPGKRRRWTIPLYAPGVS